MRMVEGSVAMAPRSSSDLQVEGMISAVRVQYGISRQVREGLLHPF